MRYIEKDKNVTREYEVIIDDAKLSSIVDELNEKCSRALKVSVNVTASNEKEALEKFSLIRKDTVSLITKTELPEYSNGSLDNRKPMYLFECEFFYKQNPFLSYLLTTALKSYRSTVGYSKDGDNTINLLIDYANNDELKPYQVRMAENGITPDLFEEYENNKDFDFALLNELYHKAQECFKLVLLSEKFNYEHVNEKERVYKIGKR